MTLGVNQHKFKSSLGVENTKSNLIHNQCARIIRFLKMLSVFIDYQNACILSSFRGSWIEEFTVKWKLL